MSEREMELEIYRRLKLLPGVAVARQVVVGGRLADLAIVQDDVLTLIECKLSAVGEAIAQAEGYRRAGDYALVVMPPRDITAEMERKFTDYGVGLAFFLPECTGPYHVEIQPRPSERRRIYLRVLAREKRPTTTDARLATELGIGVSREGGEAK